MQTSYDDFRAAADRVLSRIAEACLRSARNKQDVSLLAVTKTHPVAAVHYAARFGLKSVGENRVQEACGKIPLGPPGMRWELIGHLQSNKVRLAVQWLDRIQSVDSEKLILALQKESSAIGKTLPILLQVNAGNDPAKFGVDPQDAPRLLECARMQPNLQVDGLMTIAPLSEDPDTARRTFSTLRELRDALRIQFGLPLAELSMGMSSDMDIAIAEGSTQVRVGSALFGARESS
ncbi:MAG: YggS family pyridoxal phosphate-dependent enzyme [Opitutaceae bacterium]|jgi:pyridoxal phosphate enzyme (YggS family)|nr:YggS family pyridoxal phosphate-dependent enzyme [Opitutaceae bacterium]